MYNSIVYAEVFSFLNILDKKYLLNIPEKFIESINKNRDLNYNINYSLQLPLYKQNISKEAISIIAFLHSNYWCQNEEEKKNLSRIFVNNFKILEEEKKRIYPYENIFKKEKNEEKNYSNTIEENVKVIPYKKSIGKQFINYLKSLFNRK